MKKAYLLLFFLSTISFAAELPFATATVQLRQFADIYTVDATVEAIYQSTISSQTSGRIREINYDVGEFVERDSLLIRLYAAEQQANLDSAQANIKEAQASYNEAWQEYKRISEIYNKKLVAKSQLDKAQAQLSAAKARLDAAKAGSVQAEELINYTEIRAPFSGIVMERFVEIGETVTMGQALIKGLSLDKMRVVTQVPQTLIKLVRKYQNALIIIDEDRALPSEKITFFPYAESNSNSFKIRLNLPENIPDVYPGMFVKVAFEIGSTERLVIPQQAVVKRSEIIAVYVIKENKVHFRYIRTGKSLPNQEIEVLAGLEAGEIIALDPIAAGVLLKSQQKPQENHKVNHHE